MWQQLVYCRILYVNVSIFYLDSCVTYWNAHHVYPNQCLNITGKRNALYHFWCLLTLIGFVGPSFSVHVVLKFWLIFLIRNIKLDKYEFREILLFTLNGKRSNQQNISICEHIFHNHIQTFYVLSEFRENMTCKVYLLNMFTYECNVKYGFCFHHLKHG